jgi:hypothetical protein
MTKPTNKQAEEIAKLKARVEELERAAKPPEPFVPKSYERYDPTAGMSMPPSALRAMAQDPCNQVMRGVIQDRHAPTGRPGMIPSSQQGGGGPAHVPGGGTGWVQPAPLGPPPGVAQADRLMDHQDAKDRAELIEREARLKAMQNLAGGKP